MTLYSNTVYNVMHNNDIVLVLVAAVAPRIHSGEYVSKCVQTF